MKISKARPTNYVEQADLFAMSVIRAMDSLIIIGSFGYLDCDMYSHYLCSTDVFCEPRTFTDVYKSFVEALGEG